MAQPPEKVRVTEIKVRIDCNGCVQKIRKAFHGIDGIEDVHVDFVQQKIIVTGSADPGKLVKAIRKTRKSAVVCINEEISEDPLPEGPGALPANPVEPPPVAQQQQANPPQEPKPVSSSESGEEIHVNSTGCREYRVDQPFVPIYPVNAAVQMDSRSFQPAAYATQSNLFPPPVTMNKYTNSVSAHTNNYPVNAAVIMDPGSSQTPVYAAQSSVFRPPMSVTRYAATSVSAQPIYPVNATVIMDSVSSQPSVYAAQSNILRPAVTVTKYTTPVPSAQPDFYTVNAEAPVDSNSSQSVLYATHSNIFRPSETFTKYTNPVPAQSIIHRTQSSNTYRPPAPPAETENMNSPAQNNISPTYSNYRFPYLRSPPRYIESEEDNDYMESSNNIASVFSEENPNSCNIA